MATATATKTSKGFAVGCPKCGALEGLKIQVTDLALECNDCGEPVTKDDLKAAAAETMRLVRWLEAAEA
jgi:uncharacterized Zn finger protein